MHGATESNIVNGHTEPKSLLDIDPNLDDILLPKFDSLVAKGEILWAPYESEPVECDGFKAVFQLCPHLMKKPIQHADAPERKTGRGANPFLNPDPSFVLTHVGPSHTLMLNKYCVYRPSVILFTKVFVPQYADLDRSDIHAAWTVLHSIKRKPYMMIYNCGIDSGSSQGHKHMQLWELQSKHNAGFDLFPSRARSTEKIASNIPNVPHGHYVLRFRSGTSADDVFVTYQKLLAEIHKCHKEKGSKAYNVVMTKEWLCLIPRRSNGGERGAGSNAAGVLGLIWISSQAEKAIWTKSPDLSDFLQFLGVPAAGKEMGNGTNH